MLQNNTKKAGFTLLEILIALFIFTITAVIMAHALHTISISQTGTEKKAARLAKLQITTLLLSRDLEQASNRSVTNAKNLTEAPFQGTAYSIAFTHGGIANPTGQLQRSSLQRVHYFIEKNTIIREVWAVLDQVQTTQGLQRKLMDEVTDLRFEYLDDKNSFHNSWPPAGQSKVAELPRAVRVTITLANWGKLSQLYLLTGSAQVLHV
jgi:general secretion pathway protein J